MGAFNAWTGDEPLAASLPMILIGAMMLMLVPWERDAKERLDRLYATLPMRRRDLVTARYVECFGAILLAWVLQGLVVLLATGAGKVSDPMRQLAGAGVIAAAFAVLWAFTLPFVARARSSAPALLAFAAIGLLSLAPAAIGRGDVRPPAALRGLGEHPPLTLIGSWVVAAIVAFASYALAVRIREGQDL